MERNDIEDILKDVGWDTISIQKDQADRTVLILVCNSKTNADKFLRLLQLEKYDIAIRTNPKTKVCEILIEFLDKPLAIGCNTKRTLENYPPLQLLYDKKIEYFTTGTFYGYNEHGDALYLYNGLSSLLDKTHYN